jgi:Uma2 family endonuclease
MNEDTLLEDQSGEATDQLEEDRQWERLEDERAERMMGAKAGLIVAIVIHLLKAHVDAQRLGFVLSADCGYQIFPHAPKRVRYPDLSFLRRGRLPNDEVPDSNLRIPPDLAVEVVSPNDLAEDVETRVTDYVRVGVPLVWVLYPTTRSLRVLRKDRTATQLFEGDELHGEDVLPGFTCPVVSLFPQK